MKKIIMVFLIILSIKNLQAQNYIMNTINVSVDTVARVLGDIPCSQIVFVLNQTYRDTVYIVSTINKYKDVLTGGMFITFIVTNVNEIWYVGNKQTNEPVLTIKYYRREEDDE